MDRIKIEKIDYSKYGNFEYSVSIVIKYNNEKKIIFFILYNVSEFIT